MRIIALAALLTSGMAFAQQSEVVHVTKVLSAGSVIVRDAQNKETQIRILGVNCPDKARVDARGNDICNRAKNLQKCKDKFAHDEVALKFAKDYLLDKDVTLECEEFCNKSVRLPLRYVKLADGKDYSSLAISEGICDAVKLHTPYARQKAYIIARDKAKKDKKGIHK